ncbi:hypothetical protein [Ruegeria atlantica]|uniref:hypothetical protein n=1 Tax=Ruegeria atlantica TaxID=81569 RepID=UPI00147F90A1|nr:hypothetical protein [Ruegeria atlantica]
MEMRDLVEDRLISPDRLARHLKTTKREIGETLGIAPESLSRRQRIASVSVQTSLRHLVEILNAVAPAVGNSLMAYAWYRSEPIVGFGGRTPEEIVKDGENEALKSHILRRLEGGYA